MSFDLSVPACLDAFAEWSKRARALPTSRANGIKIQRLGRPRHTAEDMEFDGLNYDEFSVVADSLREQVLWDVYNLK